MFDSYELSQFGFCYEPKQSHMVKMINFGIVYKVHGHLSLARWFSGVNSTHGFVTVFRQKKKRNIQDGVVWIVVVYSSGSALGWVGVKQLGVWVCIYLGYYWVDSPSAPSKGVAQTLINTQQESDCYEPTARTCPVIRLCNHGTWVHDISTKFSSLIY